MVRRITQRIERHHGIGHGRKDPAEAVDAVQPPLDEGDCRLDGPGAATGREQRLDAAHHIVQPYKQRSQPLAGRVVDVALLLFGRGDEQLANVDAAGIAGGRLQRHEDQQRHDHRARPIRHLHEVEREPVRQQHDLDRHHRHRMPRYLAEQRQCDSREHVRPCRPAARQNRFTRPNHVRRIGVVADQLQRVVGLDRGRQVDRSAGEERPAAVGGLGFAQVHGDLALFFGIGLAEIML